MCHHAGDAVQARELLDPLSELDLGVLVGERDSEDFGDVLIKAQIVDGEESLLLALELQESYAFLFESDGDQRNAPVGAGKAQCAGKGRLRHVLFQVYLA